MKQIYTSGPWRVGDAGRTVFGPPTGNPSPKTVAHVASNKRADARLIAASPELLAAAESTSEALQQLRDDWGNRNLTDAMAMLAEVAKEIDAALGKAGSTYHRGAGWFRE